MVLIVLPLRTEPQQNLEAIRFCLSIYPHLLSLILSELCIQGVLHVSWTLQCLKKFFGILFLIFLHLHVLSSLTGN